MSAVAIPLREVEAPDARHPGLELVCTRLEAVMHGRAAEDLLRDVRSIPERAGIVILPAWSWERPLIDVGRKDKAFASAEARAGKAAARLLMPVRNDWSAPMVRLVAGASVPVTYRTLGMGHQMAGQSRLVTRPGSPVVARVEDLPSLAEPVFVGESTRARVTHELRRLVEAGNTARWELIHSIEPKLAQQLHVAHSAVSHEIGQTSGNVVPMLDAQGLEQVQNLMMFGEWDEESGKDKPGSVFRLIELCLAPDCFVKVDPLKYMVKHLRRDAETEIRRKIGDPHIGPKVRAVALKHPRAEVAVIVEEYRKIYPKDRLSVTRAEAALSVRPDAMASSTRLLPDTHMAVAAEPLEGALA